MRSRAASAAFACAAALAVAPAAPAATVDVKDRCWAEGDEIPVDGAGFRPWAAVRLALEKPDGEVLTATRPNTPAEAENEPVAGADGTVKGRYKVAEDTGWFGRTQTRFRMTLRLTERGNPANEAVDSFRFSRWNVGISTRGGRLRPRRPARLRAVGFTFARGKPLFAHWFRNGRKVHTRRLGVLRGPCGNLRAELGRGFPFRPVRRGRYEVRFAASRNETKDSAIRHRAVRVRRRIP